MPDLSQQLIEQVKDSLNEKRALQIIGGGSKAFMGRKVTAQSLMLNEHSGVVSYEPVELVLTVRAGTSLAEIEQTLAEHNQELAFEPPRFGGNATIGGTLACNQSGPGRPWLGSVRDHVLGVKLINGKAEHLNFGGQVMKNVAGYDVSRLQAGAMGTLGVMTEISLKVLPKAEAVQTLCWNMTAKEALQFMNEQAGSPKPITAACWVAGELYIRFSGARAAVEVTVKQWQDESRAVDESVWQKLAEKQLNWFQPEKPLWRFSVNSAAEISAIDAEAILDWGGAQRWYQGEADKAEFEALARQAGGQVQLFSGGNRQDEVMHELPVAVQMLQRRVKQSFDPEAIFNPGRLYSWM